MRKLAWLWVAALASCSLDSGTTYAPQFQEKTFQSLSLGTYSNEVLRILGKPLRIDHQKFSECWMYTPPKWAEERSAFSWQGTLSLNSKVVYFDAQGTVLEAYGVEMKLEGKSHSEVKAILGKPWKTETNAAVTIFNYTEGQRSGSHDVRALIFDGSGNLISKRAFFYRD